MGGMHEDVLIARRCHSCRGTVDKGLQQPKSPEACRGVSVRAKSPNEQPGKCRKLQANGLHFFSRYKSARSIEEHPLKPRRAVHGAEPQL